MSLNIGDQIPEFELYNHDKTNIATKTSWVKKQCLSLCHSHLVVFVIKKSAIKRLSRSFYERRYKYGTSNSWG